jgi:hypothetical protein
MGPEECPPADLNGEHYTRRAPSRTCLRQQASGPVLQADSIQIEFLGSLGVVMGTLKVRV